MWEYTDKVMQHFKNPKHFGEIKDPDGISQVGNPLCGDTMRLFIKVKEDRIEDIKYQTFGCCAAIAASEALSALAKGKKIKEVLKITHKDIADYLGGLPVHKFHCSVLGREGLHKAIDNYLSKSKK